MEQQIYEATVMFTPDQEPYPSKFKDPDGTQKFTYNAQVQFDDPNAPKADAGGQYRLYKDSDTPEGQYIKSLQAGDRVTLIYTELGKRAFYSIRVPAGTYKREAQPKQATSPPVQPVPRNQGSTPGITARPLDDEGKASFKVVLGNLLWQFNESLEVMGTNWDDLTPDQRYGAAMGLFKSARGWWREGMAVAGQESDQDKFCSNIRAMEEAGPTAWVKATAAWFDRAEADVITAVKTMALKSSDFLDTDEGMWILAQAANDFIQMVEEGADETVAHSAVADLYGFKPPAGELIF